MKIGDVIQFEIDGVQYTGKVYKINKKTVSVHYSVTAEDGKKTTRKVRLENVNE